MTHSLSMGRRPKVVDMEIASKKRLDRSDLAEELLLVENSLLYIKLKLQYFPSDYKKDQASLASRRERIVSMLEGSPD